MQINIRKLIDIPLKELFKNLRVNAIDVIFDDGIVIMNDREIIIQVIIFKYTAVRYNMLLSKEYCIQNFYNKGEITSKTVKATMEHILFKLGESNNHSMAHKDLLPFYKGVMEVYQDLYVYFPMYFSGYTESINITHYLELQFDPKLLAAIDYCRENPSPASVEAVYKEVEVVMGRYPLNPIAVNVRAGNINIVQLYQLLGVRGYVSELDKTILKYPVTSNYILGLDNIYDKAVESRSGAMAQYVSITSIRDSEFLARKLLLATMVFKQITPGDCGSEKYMELHLDEDEDLSTLNGKFYLNEDTNTLRPIFPNEYNNIKGKVIKLRSPHHCKLSDKQTVCSKCYGVLASSVHSLANMGNLNMIQVTREISQKTLSTKHVIGNSNATAYIVDKEYKHLIGVKNDILNFVKTSYPLRGKDKNVNKYSYKLIIPRNNVFNITGISLDSIDKLEVPKMSKIYNIIIRKEIHTKSAEILYEDELIPIVQEKRYGIFNKQFIKYILENGYNISNKGDIVIDINKATRTNFQFLEIIKTEFSYADLLDDFENCFSVKYVKGKTPESFTMELYRLLNRKLKVNLAVVEAIAYSFVVENPDERKYGLGRNTPNPGIGSLTAIMAHRSLGGAYGFDNVTKTLLSPYSFRKPKGNLSHPMSIVFKPFDLTKYKATG